VKSTALLYGADSALTSAVLGLLIPEGWTVCSATLVADALAVVDETVALVVLDANADGAAALLGAIRALPQPMAGVPILQSGGERLSGVTAMLPNNSATQAATIQRFAGALADHALRRPPYSPFYTLVRLLGTDDAAAMIARFADALRAAIAGESPTKDEAHRLAGLAGAIGYRELGDAWSAAEHGGADAIANALATSRATLAEIGDGEVSRYRQL